MPYIQAQLGILRARYNAPQTIMFFPYAEGSWEVSFFYELVLGPEDWK